MTTRVICGDCREVMAGFEPESVHAVVCDPPYEIRFMNRGWDGTGVAFQPETWAAVLRVLKPGGHLLAFGSTRTFHRLVCAIEDAGFKIRDTIAWLYGSGFPKSLDVSKAIDRAASIERARPRHHGFVRFGGPGKQICSDCGRSKGGAAGDCRCPKNGESDAAKQWEGWGTALKPACELICVARKPLSEALVSANVLKHGTGALNIEASRVGVAGGTSGKGLANKSVGVLGDGLNGWSCGSIEAGRWPANVVHDGSPEALEAFARFGESSTGRPGCAGKEYGMEANVYGDFNSKIYNGGHVDRGTAARFFYTAKAATHEREGDHPTVKPVSLMEWLLGLVVPPGGCVLDPFAGTGSTLVAADRLGIEAVGIEQDAKTCADAEAKIRRLRARRMIGDDVAKESAAPGQLGLDL